MTFDEYQYRTPLTRQPSTKQNIPGLAYLGLGLTGEAGEVADVIKKVFRDGDGQPSVEEKNAIKEELGDVLYYVSEICNDLGIELDAVAIKNLAKLAARYNAHDGNKD